MTGITSLEEILKQLHPNLDDLYYIYLQDRSNVSSGHLFATIVEEEGTTFVVALEEPALLPQDVSIFRRITLQVHSSLEAVGLTAVVSSALSQKGISCNMIAGYFHDHLLIPIEDADRAMQVLKTIGTTG